MPAKRLIILVTCAVFLTACATGGRHVPRHSAYKTVSYGAVMNKEEVVLGGTHTGIGSYVVSAAAIHDATSNSFLGFVVRGLAGAIVGAMAEEAITRRSGMLYTVETSNGALLEITSVNKELNPGDCVRIVHAGVHHSEIEAAPNSCSHSLQQQASATGASSI